MVFRGASLYSLEMYLSTRQDLPTLCCPRRTTWRAIAKSLGPGFLHLLARTV